VISTQVIDIRGAVVRAVTDVKITDVHTHLFSPNFGPLLLWGVDELLTYHYLVAETLRWLDMPYVDFWALPKREQANLIWQTLFIDHSPYSEACRGVLTVLDKLGLDVASRDLLAFRRHFDTVEVKEYVDRVFDLAGVESVVMTNDPFDDLERPTWLRGIKNDKRFHAALRLDGLINSWETACPRLREWSYDVQTELDEKTCREIRRFLHDWVGRIDALYMSVSLPPTFALPEDSPRGTIIEKCVLPAAQDKRIPFAVSIGVKRLTNPWLRTAGDSVGKGNIGVIEYLCANYPDIKFMVTMLSRENQHECAVAARSFRNLMIFGCWWYLNNPSLVDEITRMRFELLGVSVIPQHSDARVLDQLIYKWTHSRKIIADVLADKYSDIAATGWTITEDEIRRDVADLFGANFWKFLRQ
jgi:hypothetical protein